MTDEEAQMIKDVHDFLFKPAIPNSAITRASQIEDLLNAARSGKMAARFTLWVAGAIVAVGAAIITIKGGGVE